MKKIAYFLCVAMLFGLSALPAAADDGTTVGQVTGGFEFFSGDFNNAKFNEYRVDRFGPIGGFVNAGFLSMPTDGTHRYQFDLGYRSLEDVNANIDVLDYGKYHLDLNYQRFGHDFANSVVSLYSGDGTGRLTVPGSVVSQINSGSGGAFSVSGLEGAVANAHTIDLFLVRDRFNAGFDWMSLGPLTFNADFGYEHREGDRPYGATFGFSNAIEIPEPINYDTYNVKAGAEYAEKFLYANVSYSHSSFDNNMQSVTYDNPFLYSSPTNHTGATSPLGRNALAPSNTYDSVNVVLAKNLPLDSRLMFNFNYAWLRQDENLIAPTINPTYAVPFSGSADASVNTSSYDVRFSSRPLDKLEVKAGYRYYNHDNTTPENRVFPFAPYDSQAVSDSDPTGYVSWTSRTGNIEATYEVYDRTHVGVGYDYDSESYRNGSENSVSANTYKVFADSRAFDWLNTRLTLSFEDRNTAYPDATDSELPWLRKFYAASDQSYKADWMNTFTLTDDLSLMLQYIYADDQYDDSLFGRLNDRTHTATVETDYNLTKNVTVGAFYTYENQRTRQKSRQWNPGPPDTVSYVGNPYYAAYDTPGDFGNWQLNQNYNIHTVGLNSTIGIIPEKLTLSLDGTYSVVNGEANFKSDIGTAANDLNPYTLYPYEHVDETELIQAGGTIRYNFTKALAFALGYRYEKWHINDYQYNAPNNIVETQSGAYRGLLDMNTLYKPYEVHTAYASVTYKF